MMTKGNSSTEDANILRRQGDILERQREVKNDLAALDVIAKDLQEDFKGLEVRYEMWNEARLQANRDMQVIDRMINEVRK